MTLHLTGRVEEKFFAILAHFMTYFQTDAWKNSFTLHPPGKFSRSAPNSTRIAMNNQIKNHSREDTSNIIIPALVLVYNSDHRRRFTLL